MKEPSLHDVFISYSGSDTESAKLVADNLSATGLNVWFDRWSFVPGDVWAQSLHEAIAGVSSIAVLIGRTGLGGRQGWEFDDITLGQGSRRAPRVILVLLPGANPESLPSFPREYAIIDMQAGFQDDLAWRRLITA